MTLHPTATGRRDPMPARICQGFNRECTTPLSIYNADVVCGVCSHRRADAIAERRLILGGDNLSTHCKHGHPYTLANTYYSPTSGRKCRECGRVYKKRAA